MTEIEPKQLYENRNIDDVLTKLVIEGLLGILNHQLYYGQIWDEKIGDIEKVYVNFFYDFGENFNSEKFIQDNYQGFNNECLPVGLKMIDGNFDIYPRGVVSLKSCSIDSASCTNMHVTSRYYKKEDGQMKPYVSQIYSIPLTYSFGIEIRTDTMISAFKIEQAFREYFYRNKKFYINFKGMKIPCRVGFPDSLNTEKGAAYTMGTYDNDKYFKQSMDIGVETYHPVIDPTTEIPADTSVSDWILSTNINGSDDYSDIHFYPDYSDTIIFGNSDLNIEWQFTSNNNDTPVFLLSYIDEKTNIEKDIDTVKGNNFYVWTVPEELSSLKNIDILIPNTDEVMVYTQPIIKIVPDLKTKIVSKSSVKVLSKGYFITDSEQICGFFNYINEKTKKLEEIPFTINLKNNQIDDENPVDFKEFIYLNNINPNLITIKIKDFKNIVSAKMEHIAVL